MQPLLRFHFLASLMLALGSAIVTRAATIDPAFAPGLATLKKDLGLIEDQPDRSQTDWRPNLQLLIGVKAVGKSKQTIYFVELTTLPPPPTNTAGQPWSPALRTNGFDWSGTNRVAAAGKRAKYVSSFYPVRLRVYDESGRKLKSAEVAMAWGLLTNGLVDMCRVGMDTFHRENESTVPGPAGGKPGNLEYNDELMRAMGGGFLWLINMFQQLQTVPAANDVWEKAQCAIRPPGFWSSTVAVFRGGLTLNLMPQLTEVSLAEPGPATETARTYRLPINIESGKQNLTSVEIIVGPASGAGMLLAGIRSIRAVHPVKPQQQFIAQVLAAGVAGQDSAGATGSTPKAK